MPRSPSFTPGLTIAISTGLAILFIAHHPIPHLHGGDDALQAILQIRTMDHIVHGAMILLFLAYAYAYTAFARQLGLNHPAALAGLTAYLGGCIAIIGAALTDGFLIPAIAQHFLAATDDARIAYDLITLAGLAIQCLTKLGLILISLGITVWSCLLLTRPALPRPALPRIAGVIGLLAGLSTAILLLTTPIILQPGNLLILLLAQAAWNATAAALLLRKPA